MSAKEERMKIIRKIINYISDGTFEVNEKIYSENQLAYILNTSRSKVREALISLEIMGIVESRQGEGTFLKELDLSQENNPLQLLLFLTNAEIEDIMQMREVLEIGIEYQCTKNSIDDEIKKEMRACLDIMENSDDPHIISKSDIRFHTLLADSIKNPALAVMMNVLVGYMNLISTNNWEEVLSDDESEKKERDLLDQHIKIYDAIENNNCDEVVNAIQEHLNHIRHNLNKFEI